MSVTDPIEETERSATVSRPVLAVAAGAGATVAGVAAISSYAHLHELALVAGEAPGLAKVAPASVDGLVLFGSALIYAQHKAHQPVHPLAKFAVALGVGASLAANVVAKDPTLVDIDWIRWAVAGWPAVALGIVGHLALQLLTLWLGSRPAAVAAEAGGPDAATPAAGPAGQEAPTVAAATYDRPPAPANLALPEAAAEVQVVTKARRRATSPRPAGEMSDRARALLPVAVEVTTAAGGQIKRDDLRAALAARGESASTAVAAELMRALKDGGHRK